ncbi:MAG TPA: TetR/AcrR family transcriptional regulator [Limnobacter sp.]|nr:TetR/AcrR family transcriptional regulator [Limnobacter sp.]
MESRTRKTQDRRQQSHELILQKAAEALKTHGAEGLSVAGVMKQAGLTHGGFYAHFESKEKLIEEVIAWSAQNSAKSMKAFIEQQVECKACSHGEALLDYYLNDAHVENRDQGCITAALLGEAPRYAPATVAESNSGLDSMRATIKWALKKNGSHDKTELVLAALVGGLQIARLAHAADRKHKLSELRKIILGLICQ